MASILNADIAGGLKATGDTSGVLQIQAGSVTVANIASSGVNAGIQVAPYAAPTFSAYNNGAVGTTSIATATYVALPYPSKQWDTGGCFNNTGSTVGSTPSYSFLPNVAGYYMFSGQTENVSGGGSRISLAIYKNNTYTKQGTDLGLPSGTWGNAGGITVGALIYMNGTTDYVDMRLYDSGGQTIAAGPTQSYFSGFLARSV